MSKDKLILEVILSEIPKDFHTELKLIPNRKFRCDYVCLEAKIVIELEGGIWIQGRHTRASGFVKDVEKYNLIALEGYRIFRVTSEQTKEPDKLKKDIMKLVGL